MTIVFVHTKALIVISESQGRSILWMYECVFNFNSQAYRFYNNAQHWIYICVVIYDWDSIRGYPVFEHCTHADTMKTSLMSYLLELTATKFPSIDSKCWKETIELPKKEKKIVLHVKGSFYSCEMILVSVEIEINPFQYRNTFWSVVMIKQTKRSLLINGINWIYSNLTKNIFANKTKIANFIFS